jgi:hypothetical protein
MVAQPIVLHHLFDGPESLIRGSISEQMQVHFSRLIWVVLIRPIGGLKPDGYFPPSGFQPENDSGAPPWRRARRRLRRLRDQFEPLAAAGFTAAPGLAEGCPAGDPRATAGRAALLRLPERRAGTPRRLRWRAAGAAFY